MKQFRIVSVQDKDLEGLQSCRKMQTIYTGIIALFLGAGLALEHKYEECDVSSNWDGTETYNCPITVDCGYLKSWEGEKEILKDDRRECIHSVIGYPS